ncbi:3-hydroxybutyryl-CoA dehydrogenase [Streptomyces sp. YC504]|uniref:3-hydroxybutyryl-CoA dehydrogenase n=1 Tax=Streptomyces mesophilus TaxID=1775132 RepID=A0A6G4XA39_9ACTN|nr:3-hydroxybutyryl-CoA dehydrogenase [Streptomyces mesophilus]NGO74113.1 3-hydroxybutyryl-CoA dehydrogenase [Streptomyces mesophilus]
MNTHVPDDASISRVGVVGCGIMGAGIAEVCARSGLHVRIVVSRPSALGRAAGQLHASLDRAVAKGRISEAERERAVGAAEFTADLADLADRQFIVEAVPEDASVKAGVFRTLDSLLGDSPAILASTTSSLPIGRIAEATSRPGRVLGTHFFSPVPVAPLVELVGTRFTEPALLDRTESLLTVTLGKEVIRAGDRSCFVVNALLVPYVISAIRMVESGFARVEDVDRGMVLGCGHPMGPLRLADLVGLDTVAATARSLCEDSGESLHAPPALLERMVEEGRLGRKTGTGFYEDYRSGVTDRASGH